MAIPAKVLAVPPPTASEASLNSEPTRLLIVWPVMEPSAVSSVMEERTGFDPDSTGASLTAVTVTVTCTGEADCVPPLSSATAVKALRVPLKLAAGVQYAFLVESMVALVLAFQAVAEPALVPIFSVPVLIALTTKALTVPSMSVSLP